MPTTEARVDRLETAFASFMEKTEEALADIRAGSAEIRASNLRTDALLLEMQRPVETYRREAEEDRKEFNKSWAGSSDSRGTLVEDMVAPNARRIASEIFPSDPVIQLAQLVRQVHPTDPGRMMEIELLAAGRKHLMVIEAKRRLNPEKIREFAEKVQSVPEFMPEYAGHLPVPVVASVTIEPSVVTFLNRQRVYGVAMGDETMELVNLGRF